MATKIEIESPKYLPAEAARDVMFAQHQVVIEGFCGLIADAANKGLATTEVVIPDKGYSLANLIQRKLRELGYEVTYTSNPQNNKQFLYKISW